LPLRYNVGMTYVLPESKNLPVSSLGNLFDNTSECYKFFWFRSVFNRVIHGETVMRYEDIVDDMIIHAWYMVTEYHLNLGPKDTLESAVNKMQLFSKMKPTENESKLREWLVSEHGKAVKKEKSTLINMVPYRLQSPFLPAELQKEKAWRGLGNQKLIERFNLYDTVLYHYSDLNGLNTTITINSKWAEYLITNQVVIDGWLRYNLIKYLQKRNPSVPAIPDKLEPPVKRDLKEVTKLWKTVLDIQDVKDIYTGGDVDRNELSIDHFVPWSYCGHDELWDLNPTAKTINSKKSNNLPEWGIYFPRLREQEYSLYQTIHEYDAVMNAFHKCERKNLNDDHIRVSLYQEGLTQDEFYNRLEEILYPVYQSAFNCGFTKWEYTEI